MTLRLRDTLSRAVQAVEPLEPGRVRMYACGPTVYRYAHVGNLRTFLLADLIRRALELHGLTVVHVQNITDVGHLRDDTAGVGEDRMLIAAGLEGRTTAEIAEAYEAAFHEDAARLNLLPAHAFPRATEHVPQMIELAERLEDLGHAYATPEGNLYYAVATFPGYGRLSGNSLDALRAGHRGDVEPDKRDPADFALWKAAGPGRALAWEAPRWGRGFPGWHLECSAMAMTHLGPRFDIHTGGEDNVFPHHEDEIAQSAPLVGGPPATLWVHGAHLRMAGRKMAKSAGNVQRITELEAAGLDPLAFRYLCLTSRYGRQLDYSDASIAAAAAGLGSLRQAVGRLGPRTGAEPWAADESASRDTAPTPGRDQAHDPDVPLSTSGRRHHDAFVAAIDDNLDTPVALRIARAVAGGDLPLTERRWLLSTMDTVLGLDLVDPRILAAGVSLGAEAGPGLPVGAADLLVARTAARRARDYETADRLRRELQDLGVEVADRPDGSSGWRPVEAADGQPADG